MLGERLGEPTWLRDCDGVPVVETLRDVLADGVVECEGVAEADGVLLGVAEVEGL